jgi:lysophospholipase L1-like esterase
LKRGVRLLVLLGAAALALTAIPAAADTDRHPAETYLALGDSYAFAFNPTVSIAGRFNPGNFPGYTDAVAGALDLNLTNAACPGESSGSMISVTARDNGCQAWRANFPLHTSYRGSQLDFAVSFLQSHPDTSLVTLQIGGNDLLLLQEDCSKQNPTNPIPCILAGLPGTEATMQANLAEIYSRIRNDAHYRHTIVEVSYFAFNYNDPSTFGIAASLDNAEAQTAREFHAKVAHVLGEFAEASAPSGIPCVAGLQVILVPATPTTPPQCDIHPSAAGHAVYTDSVLDVTPRGEAVEDEH